ncbi:MAG: SRPBCC family protein [Chloroflexi bacterium]|nr:SRPBCC family protein [Chloroflexota bacterium]
MAAAFTIEADFDCSLDHLWSFVSHVPNQDHWVVGMSDSEVVGGGEIEVGSEIVGTSTEQGKSLRVTMEVVDYDPPNRVSWENTDGHTPFITVITCSGDETAARMKYEVTLFPRALMMKVVMGPLRPLGNIIANKMLRDEIALLRRALGLNS